MTEMVGPYRVLRAIGAGGSARIDLALVERAYGFQRQVVLKRPLEHLRTDAGVAATLRREAEIGGRLRHPNLVGVLDAGTHDTYDYLALEYVDGASLRKVMQREAPSDVRVLPISMSLSIIVDVARGLHEAHELEGSDGMPRGLVHRDVSPGNVLLARDGAVKLSDFGIAKDTRIATLSGSLRGTVTYMAPEQCRGHAFDRRADVFSLGVILHELVTSQRLFYAENDVASLHKVLSGRLPDPREIDPSLPSELAAITLRALARDPGERIATAKELADRLDAFAARAGIVLGSRQVSPTVDAIARGDEAALALTGKPRFTASRTAVMVIPNTWDTITAPMHGGRVAPDDEPSLVEIIERTPEPELLVREPSFDRPALVAPRAPGRPSHEHLAPSSAPRRIGFVVVLSAMLLGVAGGAFLALRSARHADPVPPVAPSTPAAITVPPIDAAPVVVVTPDAAAPTDDGSDSEITMDPDDVAATKPRPGHRRREKTKPADTIEVTPPAAGSAAGSGSAVRTRVEWNPNMLLPSDRKK